MFTSLKLLFKYIHLMEHQRNKIIMYSKIIYKKFSKKKKKNWSSSDSFEVENLNQEFCAKTQTKILSAEIKAPTRQSRILSIVQL